MSFRQGILWICNFCPKELFKPGYGLPPGWTHLFDGIDKDRKHKCAECNEKDKQKEKALHSAKQVFNTMQAKEKKETP